MLAVACVIFVIACIKISEDTQSITESTLKAYNHSYLWTMVGFAAYSYEGVGIIIPTYRVTKNPTGFKTDLNVIITFICLLLLVFNLMCLFAWKDNTA